MGILLKDIMATLPSRTGNTFEVRRCNIYVDKQVIAGIDQQPVDFVCDKIIDGKGKLAIPGLINAHTHAYMTVFRNSADDLKFNDWLFGRIMPMEDKLLKQESYWGALLGCLEMIRGGATGFLDMYIFADTTAQAAVDSGIRAVLSRGLTGGNDDIEGGKRRLREAKAEIETWRNTENINFMLAPHAPYTCDEGYMRTVAEAASELDVGIHTHISESLSEMEQIKERYRCTPPELMDRNGLLTARTVAAHCVYLTDSDMELFAKRGASVASNPVSNLKLANGIARVPEMVNAGINVCIGTDGAASNNALNMIREMGFMSLLHKGRTGDAQAVSAVETLLMATRNGARALGLGGVTGELKVGYKADIAIIDIERINMTPKNNLIAALSYSSCGNETETVIINGKIVMENREFPFVDEEKVRWNVERISERLTI